MFLAEAAPGIRVGDSGFQLLNFISLLLHTTSMHPAFNTEGEKCHIPTEIPFQFTSEIVLKLIIYIISDNRMNFL